MKAPIIRTQDFILRLPTIKDAPDIVKNINNQKISRYMSHLPFPYHKKDALEFIKKNNRIAKDKQNFGYSLAIEKAGEVIGMIGLRKIVLGHKASLGYWLGEKYWGRGLMTKAVAALLRFAFQELKLRRVYAQVFIENQASRRVLEKNGFKLEGVLKKELQKKNRFIDVYQFAKVK